MKKVFSKKVVVPVVSSLISVILTAVIILFSGLKSATTENGIYAVKDGRMIELRGNAELPLYNEALECLAAIPSGKALYISSGYGRFVKGTSCPDLVYYDGVLNGDFYEVSVSLVEIKNDALIFDSNHYSTVTTSDLTKISLTERKNMAAETTLGMIFKDK